MAIQELSEEQVRTWTLEQKDRWWLENVFRGSMPQLTLRSAATGMILGGILSLTNLYIGAKTGWSLGVGITSVILAFALFKGLSRLGLAKEEFTILENNCMQSIATAAGYMTMPLIASLSALMMVNGKIIPAWQTMLFMATLAILGVLFAFPFKRRFINDEQQPFPEGRAAGIVMDALHHGEGAAGLLKAKLLLLFAGIAAFVKFGQNAVLTARVGIGHIPEFLDEWFYRLLGSQPKILGTPLPSLTLRPELDLPMIGAGGLMGIRVGLSLLVGALVNYAILAPIFIQQGDIVPNAKGAIGFREITFWSLWCGAAMMTAASLVAFFARPDMIIGPIRRLFAKGERSPDVLGHIELPIGVSVIGVPILGGVAVWMAWSFFGINPWYGVISIAMVFFFCLLAINSTGLTSITPIGAMGKITQLSFGAIAPGNVPANLVTASITAEVAGHAANLIQDIKPGYMLGAKPRQQAIGHVLGVIAGALAAVPVFYLVFMKVEPADIVAAHPDVAYQIDTEQYPMPAATVWKAVADILGKGLDQIVPSAKYAALIGILLAIVLEVVRLRSRNRFPLSPVAIGLGFLIPFTTCFAMFFGSFFFWLMEKLARKPESAVNRVLVQNQEPICAGLIAGGALMGIAVAIAETVVEAK